LEFDFGPGVGVWNPKFFNPGVGVPQKNNDFASLPGSIIWYCPMGRDTIWMEK